MKNSTKHALGSLSFLAVSTVAVILLVAYAPKDKPKRAEKPETKTEYKYNQHTWYKFSDGSWSTLSHHPKTHERGEQITEKELETLKLAE